MYLLQVGFEARNSAFQLFNDRLIFSVNLSYHLYHHQHFQLPFAI